MMIQNKAVREVLMAMTDHTIRYFSSTTDRPLSCDVCGQLISRDGFLHQRRTLSINVLILVTEGTLYLTANGIPYTVPPNHYIFLHEGEEHFGHRASTGSLSYFWVHFFAAPPFRAVADTFSCQDSAYFFPEYGKLVSPGRILSLRGSGNAAVPMIVLLCVWCLFRVSYITLAVRLIPDIRVIFWAYPLTWSISSVIFLFLFLRGNWVHGFEKRPKKG